MMLTQIRKLSSGSNNYYIWLCLACSEYIVYNESKWRKNRKANTLILYRTWHFVNYEWYYVVLDLQTDNKFILLYELASKQQRVSYSFLTSIVQR